jgi:hypothetical protein
MNYINFQTEFPSGSHTRYLLFYTAGYGIVSPACQKETIFTNDRHADSQFLAISYRLKIHYYGLQKKFLHNQGLSLQGLFRVTTAIRPSSARSPSCPPSLKFV